MSKEGNNTKHIGSFLKKEERSHNSDGGKNYLLAIAIDDYDYCPKLYNAVKDAHDLIEVLTSRYQFAKENVITLINKEATEENILRTFRQLASTISPSDNLIIFFSGHGEYDDVFKEGYWVPVNAKQGAIQDYVSNSKIKMVLNAIRSKHTFLLIDSCFSGSLFMQYRSTGMAERLERDPSRWGLTAGRNEIVEDGEAGKNSPFADSLIYHLKNNEKSLGTSELCHKVIEDVIANANQTPRGEPLKVEGHRGGQFFFHLKGFVPTNSPSIQRRTSNPTPASVSNLPSEKKKPYLNYAIYAIIVISLIGLASQFLKREKNISENKPALVDTIEIEKKQNQNSETPIQPEKEQPTRKDRIKDRREQLANNRAQSETNSNTPTLNKDELWKAKVLPYLEKGKEFFRANPPDLEKAEEYIKRGIIAAKENGLDTEEAQKYLSLIQQQKAKIEEEKKETLAKEREVRITYGTVRDSRDGRKYKTMNILGRDWMAEDLKYEMPDSYCYNDKKDYCEKYGRFYKWKDAMKACPLGWRLPTYVEWKKVINKYGGHQYALEKLISGGVSGFEVPLSGERSSRKTWANLDQSAEYWTSYEADGQRAYAVNFSNLRGDRPMIYYPKADKDQSYYLCRCIKK